MQTRRAMAAGNGTLLPPISASPARDLRFKTGLRGGVGSPTRNGAILSPTRGDALLSPVDTKVVQGLVSDIIEIRANLDEIALRENKLRRAIQYFTVERNRKDRDDNLTMSRSFNRFSMKKPMATFERHAYSSTGSLLDHKHIYSHLSPKRLR
eukprot:Tamp_25476.p2 GENE.Tamp_25476~~Tamp_25476.p2  ORF type:complete len:153 (+),score=21.78 Tamp_25476:299-757(+)